MSNLGGWFAFALAVMPLFFATEPASAMSPRYALVGQARVVEVESPNLLKIRLQGQDRVVTVRLLGVGSPRNRDRIKHLAPEVASYIQKSDAWEQSRHYVRSLLQHKAVEIWARRYDQFDNKNRLLAYVIIPQDAEEPVDLNAEIIRKGFGFVTRDYVHVTFAGYRLLEEDAKRHRRGIWGSIPMGRVSSLEN
jgi:endonuclease YncB( thermonuclease family)